MDPLKVFLFLSIMVLRAPPAESCPVRHIGPPCPDRVVEVEAGDTCVRLEFSSAHCTWVCVDISETSYRCTWWDPLDAVGHSDVRVCFNPRLLAVYCQNLMKTIFTIYVDLGRPHVTC